MICCSNLSCTAIPGKENNHFRSQPTRSVTTGCPGIRAPSLCVSLCLGVTSAPQSPGFSSLSHWLSSHYYSGHQQPGNPTLLTSGAHAVIREIFKHSYYSKKYLSPSANRKYLKSLEIWQYIVHNIFLCSPKIFVSGPLMLHIMIWHEVWRWHCWSLFPLFYNAQMTFPASHSINSWCHIILVSKYLD